MNGLLPSSACSGTGKQVGLQANVVPPPLPSPRLGGGLVEACVGVVGVAAVRRQLRGLRG